MAGGCVPVASQIKGVTDFVIRDKIDGLLFEIGNVKKAAESIDYLLNNRKKMIEFSINSRSRVKECFSLFDMSVAYFNAINKIKKNTFISADPFPVTSWSYPLGLRSGLRKFLPKNIKNFARLLRERYAGDVNSSEKNV
jgi:hypothetical protein